MRKTFLSTFYAHYNRLVAGLSLCAILFIIAITTGFGAGDVVSRTIPLADHAATKMMQDSQRLVSETANTDYSTSLLVEGVAISKPENITKLGKLYQHYRDELKTQYGLEQRKELLDPFLFENNEISASTNPLVGNNKQSFIILVSPLNDRPTSEKTAIELGAKNLLTEFGNTIQTEFPQSRVTLNSRLYSNELSHTNTLKGTLLIAFFAALVAGAGFFLTTRRPAAAIAAVVAILFSAVIGIFICWIATFIIDYPAHLLPIVTLSSCVLGIIITAIMQTIDAHRLERGGRLGRALLKPLADGQHLTKDRITQLAKRVWTARLVLLFTFLIPIVSFILTSLVPLSHVRIFALTMLAVTGIIWISSVLYTPALQLSLEKFLPSQADIDHPTGTLSKIAIMSEGKNLSLFDKVERYLNITYQETAFSKNLGAPALASLLFLIACIPWGFLSPAASTAPKLSNAQPIVRFQEVAEDNFPSLTPSDFSVIAKASPSELTHWADDMVSHNPILKISSSAVSVQDGKYSTINFSYRIDQPSFSEQESALNSLITAKADFEYTTFSESARNIQAITATRDSLYWLIPTMAIIAFLALYIVFGNLALSILHVFFGMIMEGATMGLTILVSASGLLNYLPGVGVHKKLDVTGLIIGGFLSIIVISVVLLEPHLMRRPATSRQIWLILGVGGVLTALNGQLAATTIGIILLNTVVITIIASILIVPQVSFFSSQPQSILFGRSSSISKLHSVIRNYLHLLFASAPNSGEKDLGSDNSELTAEPKTNPRPDSEETLSPTQKSRIALSRVRRRQIQRKQSTSPAEDS